MYLYSFSNFYYHLYLISLVCPWWWALSLLFVRSADLTKHLHLSWNCHMTQELHTYVYIPRIEYRNSNKYLYTNVHSRIIHNRQKVATVHVSVNSNQNMDKQNVEYTYSRILFNHKKKLNFYTWYNMYLENIVLTVIHKTQKDHYCNDYTYEVSRVNNS